jgi:hypothetical protein
MYALVHVELRYIAAFFALFWVGLFSGLTMPPGRDGRRRLASLIAVAVVLAMVSPTAISVARHFRRVMEGQGYNQWQVAESLRQLGVKPGDRVARIGGGFGMVYWARLLGVTEVAEVPFASTSDFWSAKPEVQAQVIQAFQHLGVKAIIADMSEQPYTPGPEWRRLGDGFYALQSAPDAGQPK